MKEEDKARLAIIILAVVCWFWPVALLTGCKTQRPIGPDIHRKDSTNISVRVDTFIMHTHDSVVLRLPCSDSVEVITKEVYREKSTQDKHSTHDTVYTHQVDSVPYPVEVEKLVIKNSRTATTCEWIVFLLAGTGIVYITLKILKRTYLR